MSTASAPDKPIATAPTHSTCAWLVSSSDQGLETSLDKLGDTAAKHGLLAEEIGLAFLGECGLDHTGSGQLETLGVSQGDFLGIASGILLDCDQARHTGPFLKELAEAMTWCLGSSHDHIDIGWWGYEPEANREVQSGEQQAICQKVVP